MQEKLHHQKLRLDETISRKVTFYPAKSTPKPSHENLNKSAADENGNVPCPECGKMLKAASLSTHMEDRHTDSPGFSCALCGSVLRSRNSWLSHMSRSHRGIKTKDVPMNPMSSPLNAKLKKKLKKQKKMASK